jgi:hypothetical protein
VVVALDAESWEEIDRRSLPVDEIFSIQHVDAATTAEVVAKLASHASRLLKERLDERERDVVNLRDRAEAIERHAEATRQEVVARDILIRDKGAELRHLEDMNRENERKIYGLLETVHGKDIHIQNRDEIIREKDAEIQRRDELVSSKDAEILRRDEVLRVKEAEIQRRDELVACKDGDIQRRDGILRDREEQIGLLRSKLQENDQELRQAREALRRNLRKIGLLDDTVRQKEQQLTQGKAELQASENRIGVLTGQIEKLHADISRLHDSLNIYTRRIADLEGSRSWRITRPIRAVKNYILRRQRIPAELPPKAKNSTGAAPKVVSQSMTEVGEAPKRPEMAPALVEHRFDLRGAAYPVVILTTPHCNHVAMEIETALGRVGIPTEIIFEMPEGGYRETPHFVICPQFFARLPGLYVSFQMEQSVSSRWFTDSYVRMLENSFSILDYSTHNVQKLQELGLHPKQIFYVPVGYLDNYPKPPVAAACDCDVLFYGDIQNERRRTFIDELGRVCKVKVHNDLFGEALHAEMANARLIVNIHYYQGSLLETTRLWECVSLGHLVVSERAADMTCHPELEQLIDFVDVDDVSAMVQRVAYWLKNDDLRLQRIKQNEILLRDLPNQFDYHFYRFLLATDNISFDDFWNLVGDKLTLPGDKLCLNLPEYVERSRSFDRDNRFGLVRFTGLRHSKGWLGCAMSYKLMMRLARKEGLTVLTVCEDDVEFPPDFGERWSTLQRHLVQSEHEWDVFSGLMANLHADARIVRAYGEDGTQYVETDKLISMVFNVYAANVFDIVESWDASDRDESTNTIDRFLENHSSLRVLTTIPFLVGHKEDLHSTLWGFQNTQYSQLIEDSTALMSLKLEAYLDDQQKGSAAG